MTKTKVYDKPITIQRINEATETYETFIPTLHASINKSKRDNEYLANGAIQDKQTLVFEVRYNPLLEEINLNTQLFRVVYKGVSYDITDYDDYKLEHITVKILGVSV